MAIYQVFSQPVWIRYKTSICSKATCIYIVTNLLVIICPFLISYYSQGFWRKIDFYREQPHVMFKHKMLLVLETKHPNQLIFWSTYKQLNKMMDSNFLRITPSIEHREEDFNMDGKKDELQMKIEVPLTTQEILSLKLFLIFDYKLSTYLDFDMESAAYVHYNSALGGATFSLSGELSLVQREPFRHCGENKIYKVPVIDFSSHENSFDSLEHILFEYHRRNISTSLTNAYPVWESGHAVNQSFQINLVIFYPEQTILYKVGFWQLLKWAVVQYMAIFLIFSWIAQKLKVYMFQKQMVPTIVINPVKQKI